MKGIKLGKTARLVLIVGAFVIILATLFIVYARKGGEQADLEVKLAGAQTQLSTLISGREATEVQLAAQQDKLGEAQALLNNARGSFPKAGASIEYDEVLTQLASSHSLAVTSMTADSPRQKKVGDVTFVTVAFDVEVRGDMMSILSMVNDIASDKRFASATVDLVSMSIPERMSYWETPEAPTAKIELVGYSYLGE
jgi:hypothetical protein